VLRRVNLGTAQERIDRSEPAKPNETLQINFSYDKGADLVIELDDGRISTPFLPESSKDGNEVVKFAALRENAFEAFELVCLERGGAYEAEGGSVDDAQRARSFTIGVQHCGKRAPFRVENICDTIVCEFWQPLPSDTSPGSSPNRIKLDPHDGVNWAPDDSSQRNQQIFLKLTSGTGESAEATIDVAVNCKKIAVGETTVYVVATTDTNLECRRIFLAPSIGRARLYMGLPEYVAAEGLESSTSVNVAGVGISVVSTTGGSRELVYAKLSKIGITQEVTTHYAKLGLSLTDLQIDNCDRDGLHPVLLSRDLRANQQHPVVRFTQITKRGQMGGEQALGAVRFVHQKSGRYLHSHSKNIRGPFNEIVVVDHKDRNNLFTLANVALTSIRSGDGQDSIQYGDDVQLKHKETGSYLHSHDCERKQGNQYEVSDSRSVSPLLVDSPALAIISTPLYSPRPLLPMHAITIFCHVGTVLFDRNPSTTLFSQF
jgi:hypothetical protein